MMKWNPITFQNMMSNQAVNVEWLFDYISIFLFSIIILVGGSLMIIFFNKYMNLFSMENSLLEFLWTLLPSVVLVFIGGPSLKMLYKMESSFIFDMSIKITAHQWYWTYDYSDMNNLEFDSYMQPFSDLSGSPSILDVDNHLVISNKTSYRFLVSSADVLHSWAVPSLALKADATPGRMNILFSNIMHMTGVFFGQCSEICGANHSFMPIVLEVVSPQMFFVWTKMKSIF